MTTRNEIFSHAIVEPMIRPSPRPNSSVTAIAGTVAQPALSVRPRIIPLAAIADATERSMPAEMITKVAPSASTNMTLLDLTTFIRLSHVPNAGSVIAR